MCKSRRDVLRETVEQAGHRGSPGRCSVVNLTRSPWDAIRACLVLVFPVLMSGQKGTTKNKTSVGKASKRLNLDFRKMSIDEQARNHR